MLTSENLGRIERRQQAGQARRQHRLAGARRADEQQVVTAGRGDLERPLGGLLALDLGKLGIVGRLLAQLRHRRAQHLAAVAVVDQGEQARGRQDLDVAAEPGGLAAARRRADQAEAVARGRERCRQDAAHRADRAIERQLAQRQIAPRRIRRDRTDRDQHRERDRQVEVAALLEQVGRRQVDGDPPGRQADAQSTERAAHALAQFADRLVGQADDRERGQAGADLHLDVDRLDVDAGERDGMGVGHAERGGLRGHRSGRMAAHSLGSNHRGEPHPRTRCDNGKAGFYPYG